MESPSVSGNVEFRLENKEKEIGATLQCYASGSGALHFVYGDRNGKATGDKVTLRDVKYFLKHRKPEWIGEGWLIGEVSSYAGLLLFKPCRRLGPDELELLPGGRVVRYSNKISEQHITLHDLRDEHEIHHISTKAQVLFYLAHERELDSIIYRGGL